MSWRAESTFVKSSKLTDDEKEFLKVAKKLREVLKLEEKQAQGDTLDTKQQEKVDSKPAMLKEVAAIAVKLPGHTEVLEKNPDISELLPSKSRENVGKKREQEQARRERKDREEEEERHKAAFQDHHARPVTGVAMSNDSNFLFTCSKDKLVLCWSMRDRMLRSVCTLAGHQGALWALDVSPATPSKLLSGGADGKVMVWPADTICRQSGTVRTNPSATINHGGIIRVLKWCPFDLEGDTQRFASASEKFGATPAFIAVWKLRSSSGYSDSRGPAEQVLKLENLPTKANDLRWGGGAKIKLFSAHDNGYVGIWSAEAPGGLLKTLNLHKGAVSSLCLTADGNTLLTASHDSSAKAVDVSKPSCEVVATYKANRPLNTVVVASDYEAGTGGRLVVAGGKDDREVTTSKTLEDEFDSFVLDGESGQPVATGTGHFGPVHALLCIPRSSGDCYASVSEDGCVRVHDLEGKLLHADTAQ